MIANAGSPHACKLSTTTYGTHNMTRAQFKEMESLIAARFAALEDRMQRGKDELASKLEEVKGTLEEVKRTMEQNAVENAGQTRRVSRIKGNAEALSAPIQRIKFAETQLDAIAQALNQSARKEREQKGEYKSV